MQEDITKDSIASQKVPPDSAPPLPKRGNLEVEVEPVVDAASARYKAEWRKVFSVVAGIMRMRSTKTGDLSPRDGLLKAQHESKREFYIQKTKSNVEAINRALDGMDDKRTRFFDWETKLINSKSPLATAWDIQTTILLLLTAVMTPYEVTFVNEARLDGLFFVNVCIDLCFFVDMIFQFFIPFPDPVTGQLVSYHALIRKRYLRGWFVIDLVSILPFNLIQQFSGEGSSDALGDLKLLRAIRLLRLAKLLRVLRGIRMFKRWEARLAVNYAIMNLMFLVMVLVFGCHWLACGYGFLVTMDADADWSTAFPFTYDEKSSWDRFSAAIYWSVGMVTGQGDVNSLNVHTTMMRTTYTIVAGIAGVANAYLIGGVVSLLERMNERKSEFYRDMDILNEFISSKHMAEGSVLMDGKVVRGEDLCEKLRSYFIFRHSHGKLAESFQQIIESCSVQMQNTVAAKVHTMDLASLSFFRTASEEFITQLTHEITPKIYAAKETVFDVDDTVDAMFIVEKGLVFARGRIIRDGDVLGQEVFEQDGGKRGYLAYTLSEAVLLVISSDAIRRVVERSGNTMMRVRLKVMGAINKLKISTRRAAKVTISCQDFHEGYEVLRTVYPDDILEVDQSPIVALFKTRVENYLAFMHDYKNHLSATKPVFGRSASHKAFNLENPDIEDVEPIRIQHSGRESLFRESTKRRKTSMVGEEGDIVAQHEAILDVPALRSKGEDFFCALERRSQARGRSMDSEVADKNSIRAFLQQVDSSRHMAAYTKLLHDDNHVTLEQIEGANPIVETKAARLMMMGIPYSDASKIAQASVRASEPAAADASEPAAAALPPRAPGPRTDPAPQDSAPAAGPSAALQALQDPGARGGPALGQLPGPGVGLEEPWPQDRDLAAFLQDPGNFKDGREMARYAHLLGVQHRMTLEDLTDLGRSTTGQLMLVTAGVPVGDAMRIVAAARALEER